MKKGRNNRLAGQIGECLVCAELGRRGYVATSFTGNVPEFDLIVTNDELKTIPIQVKCTRSDNWLSKANLWIDIEICEKEKRQIDHGDILVSNPDLIFVCVAIVAPDANENDRFFILKKKDLQNICSRNYRKCHILFSFRLRFQRGGFCCI